MHRICSRLLCLLLCWSTISCCLAQKQKGEKWRAATVAELQAVLPARAPVEAEHIETEMRTANGIVSEQHKFIAAVVLITAGYAADGKYSHYLLVQSPMTLDSHTTLEPGSYVVGWHRAEDGLEVHFFNSATGVEKATGMARPLSGTTRVESFRIWAPSERKGIQIGRFLLPYTLP